MENEASQKDADVTKIITDINSEFEEMLKEVIATTKYPLYINDSVTGNRLIKSQETNLGDLVSDAYRVVSGADIGTVNGGGIRVDIAKGDITKGDITVDNLIAAHPFGNELCVVEATGQQIADMLETASHNYMLKDGGDGLNMFVGDKILQDCIMKDYQVVMTYVCDYCNGVIPAKYSKPYGSSSME